MMDEDDCYMKIVDLDEIYNFLVFSFFSVEDVKDAQKSYIKLRQHKNHVLSFVALEK